jgi:hypothetical protein
VGELLANRLFTTDRDAIQANMADLTRHQQAKELDAQMRQRNSPTGCCSAPERRPSNSGPDRSSSTLPSDSSGNYTLPQAPFVANTLAKAIEVNNNFSDIAAALTDSESRSTRARRRATST